VTQTYRLKLSAPALRMKVATRIPAQLVGGNAITVALSGGIYTIAVDQTELDGMVLQTIEDNTDLVLSLLHEFAYAISTDGDFTLPSDRSNIVLTPGTPSVRTVSLPAGAARNISVSDGLGDWATNNVTFAVAGGTINGAATWVGTIDYGRFLFTPLGDGNYLASGIG
jgi:hypothetical protein